MSDPKAVFDKTYESYVAQLTEIDFGRVAENLGAEVKGDKLLIPLFMDAECLAITGRHLFSCLKQAVAPKGTA
ncbi:MAG: hypothetical protein R6U38_00990 [Desulfatiglandaceae bacterium]